MTGCQPTGNTPNGLSSAPVRFRIRWASSNEPPRRSTATASPGPCDTGYVRLTVTSARDVAHSLIGDLEPRWSHVHAAGLRAEELCDSASLPEHVAIAAWLHDIGYSPAIAHTGFHPLDGARFLVEQGAPREVVRLAAWHTGAGFEAQERGLLGDLDAFAQPQAEELDALTMIDLATSPTGEPVLDVKRIAEILSRYDDGHPVHEAVENSRGSLLASSRRAKLALGLPQDWPVCC